MYNAVVIAAAMAVLPLPARGAGVGLDPLDQWPQWRGPLATGVAPRANPPVTWSEQENVRWKTSIPGKGHATPIIWGDRVFLTTAADHGEPLPPPSLHSPGAHDNVPAVYRQRFMLLAVDRRNGAVIWERTLRTARPHESAHETGSWASNSPVTDGERVFAFFGSQGLYALDVDGNLLWQTDLGDMQVLHGHGEGASPVLYGDTLVVNWDHEGESFVTALDKRTGEQRWKAPRNEATSWSTPLIVEHDGTAQAVIAATNRIRAYDLNGGRLIWECGGLSGNVVASPVTEDGFVYAGSSYEKRALLAIRLAHAKGDITGTGAVVWTRDHDTPYVPSPLLYGGLLYYLKHYQGFLTCVDAKTGATKYGPERLAGMGNVYASLAGAAGRVYVVSTNGSTVVAAHGPKLAILARNQLDDSFSASPALVGNEIYLRGARNLYCIAQEGAK